jgi:hypothetical protein
MTVGMVVFVVWARTKFKKKIEKERKRNEKDQHTSTVFRNLILAIQ